MNRSGGGLLDWTEISNIASLVGGLLVGGFLIWQVIEKAFGNISWIKKRREEKEKKEKKKRKAEYLEFTEEFVNHFVPPLMKELKEHNLRQDEKIDRLIGTSNDQMRMEITRAYYKYLPYKKIFSYEKEGLTKIYKDYHSQGGNTYIDDIWEQMKTWTAVLTEADLYKEES